MVDASTVDVKDELEIEPGIMVENASGRNWSKIYVML